MLRLCLLVSLDGLPDPGLRAGLGAAGFRACPVDSVAAAALALRQWSCDVVVLVRTGCEPAEVAIRQLRACSAAPVVVVTCAAGEAAQLRELEAGAAAVIAGGESPRLVGARLLRLLAATTAERPAARAPLRLGSLSLDPERLRASVRHVPLDLTPSQFEVLFSLASRAGDTVTREALIRALGACANPGRRSPDTHVYWIRRRLEAARAFDLRVESVRGRGYCLSLAVALHGVAPRAAAHSRGVCPVRNTSGVVSSSSSTSRKVMLPGIRSASG